MDGTDSSYSCFEIHICWKVESDDRVVPPESTMLAYRSFRMSTSHFMIELYVVSWMPADSMPRNDGWKSASGQRKRSLPMVITWPSGSSYDFSSAEELEAVCISWSKS